jgi:hypothetical protein
VLTSQPTDRLYIALEQLDFSWRPAVIATVKEMWKSGIPLADIVAEVDRDPDEVLVLLIDLARRKWITSRPGGIWGGV